MEMTAMEAANEEAEAAEDLEARVLRLAQGVGAELADDELAARLNACVYPQVEAGESAR